MNAPLDNAGWIRMDVFCAKHGLRPNTVQKRVHDGIWERGRLYSNPDGGTGYIHEERALAWLKEQEKI